MREKELRLALVCYGGVSLAIYMHGITKEVWKLLQASRATLDGAPLDTLDDSARAYGELLTLLGKDIKIRVLTDIIAGASAGGINGIFLGQAISTGQSLEPLRDLWLRTADVENLLDPEARPTSHWSKIWAQPLVWAALAQRRKAVDALVEPAARHEVRAKLSRFIRSRWFEPPFGGETFSNLLFNALDAMAEAPKGPPLLPDGQPLDLFVTVTDLAGHPQHLKLHSPPDVLETEHRLVISLSDHGESPRRLGHPAEMVFAARATASFPGAFPPFQVAELERVLEKRGIDWPGKEAFLRRNFPGRVAAGLAVEDAALIDGSVLANAPFRPAIEALRQRPAHREVDRRFVYIDPKPGRRGLPLFGRDRAPGFFSTIIRSMADIPREQPIRDNLEALEGMSGRIRRLRHVVDAMAGEVNRTIEHELGGAFFLDRPNPERLAHWRSKAQTAAVREAGFAYPAYGHLKLSSIVEEVAVLLSQLGQHDRRNTVEAVRQALWGWVREAELDQIGSGRAGARAAVVDFFRGFDLGFRIRRLRFVARRLLDLSEATDPESEGLETARRRIYDMLAPFLDRRLVNFYDAEMVGAARTADQSPGAALEALAGAMRLTEIDLAADAVISESLASLPKAERRQMLQAYLGFPFYDIATLPLLQGEGLDEFDPIKVDRIAPDDATSIRSGGAEATLKGIQFNSFGAFFSRAYRENDYLWGRLHGAERLIDILISTLPGTAAFPEEKIKAAKQAAFRAIIAAERPYLGEIQELIDSLETEIG